MEQFKNVILQDRSAMSSQNSVEAMRNYALIQDAKIRSRALRHGKATWILAAAVTIFPVGYIITGLIDGCWTSIHNEHKFSMVFGKVGKSYRQAYRPEIYLRDQQAHLYKLEQENIEKEKKGEKVTTTSPITLWH